MSDPNTDANAGTHSGTVPDFIRTTRDSYDAMAHDYAERFPDGLGDRPLDRGLLHTFAELVRPLGPAPVADMGSGPGHVTRRLHELGVPAFGLDVSPRMVALAREAHPGVRFHVGSMTSPDLPDESLAGVIALYSLIHIPTDRLPATLAEFHRVLLPGGHVFLAFTSGDDDHLHLSERFGHTMALDYYFRRPGTVAEALSTAGFRLHARVVREPDGEEKRPRGFLLARK